MAEIDGELYGGLDIPLGIQHLQLLGVKYFMASSVAVEQAANADPALERVATSGPWHTLYEGSYIDTTWDIYLVRDSQIVTPLVNQPVVLKGVGNSQAQWLPVSADVVRKPVLLDDADDTGWPRELGQRDCACVRSAEEGPSPCAGDRHRPVERGRHDQLPREQGRCARSRQGLVLP